MLMAMTSNLMMIILQKVWEMKTAWPVQQGTITSGAWLG